MKAMLGLLAMCSLLLSGCAAVGPRDCTGTTAYTVTPTMATLDHMAAPPANQQQFIANAVTTYPMGCAVPASAIVPAPFYTTWTSSDPVNAPIDSTFGPTTDGVATCKGATTVPVTLTALSAGNMTATLVCK
ncbi:MAG TPA: hypothetical protein VFC39_22085 [Acidobacteriaceae bacterium]|nr:hypothetical protein [Acidobacteriaceae bacterium]